MGYLHGVEVKEVKGGAYPIRAVDSAVIGLVGTAIKGPIGEPTLITSMSQARDAFGDEVGGLTIISALETIFAHGGATCVVVNVADATTLTKVTNTAGDAIKKTGGKWATKVYEATISGDGDFTAKVVSGMDRLPEAVSKLGVKPKVILAPGYSQLASVFNKMVTMAEKLRAKAIADMAATSVSDALTKRGTTYNVSDDRLILTYPTVTRYNADQAEEQVAGLSQYVAAAMVSRDAEQGYWVSPSNYQLTGVLSAGAPISASISDEQADTNLLNAQGIVTLFRARGTGYRVWGNWTSAYPTDTSLTAMIAPGRVADVLDESVQTAALNFLDRPINQALIDIIKESVNAFIRTLIGDGAIVDGECTYDAAANPATEVAQGKLRYRISFAPSPSLDRLTFESFVDIQLLNSLT